MSTAAYLPVPVALALVLLGRTTTFGGGILIPIVTTGSVFAGCVFEVSVLKALADSGHGTAVRIAAGVGSGEVILMLPAIAYSLVYYASHGHIFALEVFTAFTVLELAAGTLILELKSRRGRRRINSFPIPPSKA